MTHDVRKWFDLPRILNNYRRRMPLILVNGLAEQPESWFANRTHLTRQFDVKVPRSWSMTGSAASRIDSGGEVTVDYLAGRLGATWTSSYSGRRITWWARAWAARSSCRTPCVIRSGSRSWC